MKNGVLTWDVIPPKKGTKQASLKFEYKGGFKDNKFQDKDATLKSNAGIYKGGFKNGLK